MPFSTVKTFNGFEFVMQFCSNHQENGVVISPDAVLTRRYIVALSLAKTYFDNFYPYSRLFHIQYRENEINAPYKVKIEYINLAKQALNDTSIDWSNGDVELFKDIIHVLAGSGSTVSTHPKKKQLPSKGYIYLIEGAGKQYKIGKTKNPKSRIKTLGVSLPFPIEILHIIPSNDYDRAEKHLHKAFTDYRGRGEWFSLENRHVEWIKCIEKLDTEDMQS